ncbi:RNA polymerase sigma-70 factor [Dysgonomonas sp. 25]|uniref:RNA polymerase sigma-70 factor n=1 Tax=Dysgonomonas sp. 25 TaxID=2302933 RepID=UPI0013D33861|nr:RNA polymerase sigma-70 factor [Dysgonomonas sp. 25]NDV68833.1 RNA polymerase sigma-70 factor [Dysgonomonas sp. 25]
MQAADLQLFNELYAKNYSKFVRFAYSYVRDIPTAEDFVTEAFMAYWNNRHSLKEGANIQAYILTIIKNKSLNYLRDTELRRGIIEKIGKQAEWEIGMRITTLEACDPNEIFSNEVQEIIDKALASMPLKTLEVFMLSRYKDKTYKEISEEMDVSVKTVEFHMSKALTILKKELKDYLPAILYISFFIS